LRTWVLRLQDHQLRQFRNLLRFFLFAVGLSRASVFPENFSGSTTNLLGKMIKSEKLLPFWNAVSVAVFTVLAGILTGVPTPNCHKITPDLILKGGVAFNED